MATTQDPRWTCALLLAKCLLEQNSESFLQIYDRILIEKKFSTDQVQEILDRAKEFSRIPPEEFTELESGLEGIEGEREGERGGGGGEVKTQPLDSYPPSRGKDLDSGQHLEPRGAAMEASELTELNREPGKSEPSKQEEREAGKDEGMDSEADQPSDIDHRERDRLGEDHREQETPAKDQAVDLEKHNMPDCDLEPDPELPGSPDDLEQRSRASRSPRTEPGAVGLGGGGGGDAFSNRLRKSPAGLSVLESSRASRSGARERNARPLFERSSENTFRELEEAIRGSSRGLERSGEESRTVENGTRTTVLENCGTWDPSSCDGSPEIESLSPHDQPDPSPLSSSTGHNIRNRRLVGSAGGGGGGPVTGGAGSGAGGRSNHTPANRGQSLTYNNHHQYRSHSSQSYRSWGEQRKERNTGRRWAGGNSNGGVGGRFWENSNGYGSYSYSHRKSWSCLMGSSEGLQENSQKSQGAVCGGSTGEQSQLSYSPPSSSSSSSSLSCTETDRERGRERDTDRERWERERGRSVAAAPLSQDSSLGASWTLFKPPPAFPVDNSSAKTVPKISYASKVKGSNCPPAPNSQPQMLGAIFQNEWGLSFISEPGSAVVAEGGGAVLIEGAPQPHTPPSFGNGVTPDPPAPEEAGGLAPPIPSFPIGCLLKEEEPETELASSDVMSEKQCRHLLDALRYHTREWDQLLNRHKRDPTMVVWYEDSLERPA